MISDTDIWRAANLLIRKHGANAELEAANRADLMLDRGDDDGRLLWMRIRRAVEALQGFAGWRGTLGLAAYRDPSNALLIFAIQVKTRRSR